MSGFKKQHKKENVISTHRKITPTNSIYKPKCCYFDLVANICFLFFFFFKEIIFLEVGPQADGAILCTACKCLYVSVSKVKPGRIPIDVNWQKWLSSLSRLGVSCCKEKTTWKHNPVFQPKKLKHLQERLWHVKKQNKTDCKQGREKLQVVTH